MRILVTGVKGQLGYDIVKECEKNTISAVGVDIEDMDITDLKQVEDRILNDNLGIDAVIHCAAWTAVDKAEDEKEKCFKVNVIGTKNIANVCEKLNIPMMYFSTDYVFDGQGTAYWKEYGQRNPLNYYGYTKFESEKIVEKLEKYFIIRTSWVFGINGNNFVKTMLNLGKTRSEVNVVDDQIGSPTYTYDLAKLVVEMIKTDKYGIYHATNEGICSWYEFTKEIFKIANISVNVNPVSSNEFPTKAKRPHNSRMSKEELDRNGFQRLPKWQDALKRYLSIINK